jgi:hypothetical protein
MSFQKVRKCYNKYQQQRLLHYIFTPEPVYFKLQWIILFLT